MNTRVSRTDAEWRKLLTKEQYSVSRCKGTEPANTGRYRDFHYAGVYRCVCCGNALFSSRDKVTSPAKWPAFWTPIVPECILTRPASFLLVHRREVLCSACDAHLGYVFGDRRSPTGHRYFVNSASLLFEYQRESPDSIYPRIPAAIMQRTA